MMCTHTHKYIKCSSANVAVLSRVLMCNLDRLPQYKTSLPLSSTPSPCTPYTNNRNNSTCVYTTCSVAFRMIHNASRLVGPPLCPK